ncbi:MAG: elongation factor P 5-aminopentanone reductase [Syntrophomonadaceae bacterium]
MPVQMQSLKGHVCLITGASRGIGAHIACKVAAAGALTVINYLNSEHQALQLVEQLQINGYQAMAVKADISQGEDVEKIFAYIENKYGEVDMLVNNAGISLRRLFIDTSEAEWQEVIDINLKGSFLCCRRALPAMIRNRFGRIVNIASIWGLRGASCEVVYAVSKGGLIALTKSLAAEMGPSGINVNAVAPGPVETDMLYHELEDDDRNALIGEIPLRRLAIPDDIASACLFLLSPAGSYINGQIISLDGGWKV